MAAITATLSTPLQKSSDAQAPILNRYFHIPSEGLTYRDETGKLALSHKCKETLYRVAAAVFILAYISLAVIAAGAAHLFSPGLFPIVGIMLIPFTEVAYRIFERIYARATEQKRLHNEQLAMREELEKLQGKSLTQLGFRKENIQNLGDLSSEKELAGGIAYYNFWKEMPEAFQAKAKDALNTLKKSANPSREEVAQAGHDVLEALDQALVAKVKAAYFYGLVHHPLDRRELSELCEFIFPSVQEQCYADAAQHPVKPPFAIFRRGDKQEALSIKDLAQLSIPAIAAKLF